jgi:hypothetical protein
VLIGVLFLMLGTLAAEVSLFGLRVAALAGAVLFGLSAISFAVAAVVRGRRAAQAPVLAAEVRGPASSQLARSTVGHASR